MRIGNKLKSKQGETLIETLVSMLLIALALLMLAGSIITTAQANREAKDAAVFLTQGAVSAGTGELTVSAGGKSADVPVDLFQQGERLYYYEART